MDFEVRGNEVFWGASADLLIDMSFFLFLGFRDVEGRQNQGLEVNAEM